jgi:pilus assembly protein FimV
LKVNTKGGEEVRQETEGLAVEVGGHEDIQGQAGPIDGLKAAVLAIDWEITPPAMERLVNEIDMLSALWEEDKILHTFLRLLKSLVNYVSAKKGDAHPDSVKLLHSVYGDLEKIAMSDDLTEKDYQQILSRDIDRFNKLKEQVSVRKESAAPQSGEEEDYGSAPDEAVGQEEGAEGMTPHEAFAYALEEIKETIKDEFRLLRAEIKLWREQK